MVLKFTDFMILTNGGTSNTDQASLWNFLFEALLSRNLVEIITQIQNQFGFVVTHHKPDLGTTIWPHVNWIFVTSTTANNSGLFFDEASVILGYLDEN